MFFFLEKNDFNNIVTGILPVPNVKMAFLIGFYFVQRYQPDPGKVIGQLKFSKIVFKNSNQNFRNPQREISNTNLYLLNERWSKSGLKSSRIYNV